MIIEARDDIVTLQGSLIANQWPAIQAPANLLLRFHPNGILIDAGGITRCTDAGARTFLDAMEYIERHRARIVVCSPPPEVHATLKHIPNLRSQLAIAATCDDGRASLEMATSIRRRSRAELRAAPDSLRPRLVMIPLVDARIAGEDALARLRNTIALAVEVGMRRSGRAAEDDFEEVSGDGRISEADQPGGPAPVGAIRGRGAAGQRVPPLLHLVAVLEVPRAMPINAPLTEEEERARELLTIASALCDSLGVTSQTTVARAREAGDEIAAQATHLGVEIIALALPQSGAAGAERLAAIADALLQRAHCEIVFAS